MRIKGYQIQHLGQRVRIPQYALRTAIATYIAGFGKPLCWTCVYDYLTCSETGGTHLMNTARTTSNAFTWGPSPSCGGEGH